jgi:hypothetical protein
MPPRLKSLKKGDEFQALAFDSDASIRDLTLNYQILRTDFQSYASIR